MAVNVLITDIIFSAFLGPDEYLQDYECPVGVWSVTSEDHLSSERLPTFDRK